MNDWSVELLESALTKWNERLTEMWALLTESPETFKGGAIWATIHDIHGAIQGIAYGLLVLFWAYSLFRSGVTFRDLKRPELTFKLFFYFILAKGGITYGMDLMLKIFVVCNGVVASTAQSVGLVSTSTTLPSAIVEGIHQAGFLPGILLLILAFVGFLVIVAGSFILILTVYGRFFRLYLYSALSPLALSALAGEQYTGKYARSFIRGYIGVCLEGAVIVIACVLFGAFVGTEDPVIDPSASIAAQMTGYLVHVIFNMLILVGMVKGADRICKEMFGL